MNNNTLSSNLERIKNAVDDIRENIGGETIEEVAENSNGLARLDDYFNTNPTDSANVINNFPYEINIPSNTTSLVNAFSDWPFTKVPKINFGSNVTDIGRIFSSRASNRGGTMPLSQIDLSGWTFTNITNISGAFSCLKQITTIDFSSGQGTFDKLTNMGSAFDSCRNLQHIYGMEKFNNAKITAAGLLFYYCVQLKSVDLSYLDLSDCTNFQSICGECTALQSVTFNKNIIIGSNAMRVSGMFRNCSNLVSVDLSMFNFSKVPGNSYENNFSDIFSGCSKIQNVVWPSGMGDGYSTSLSQYNSTSSINISACPNITRDSLLDLFNKLSDLVSAGKKRQRIYLHSSAKSRLSSEDIAIATVKGWDVQ